MDSSVRPRPCEGYVLEQLGDEIVIYHPSSEAIFYCNATAALIFRLCDGERDVAAITQLLSEAYPGATERMAADVSATLEQLVQHHAIELT
jgi:coenzyme PQQ biosynthesis protein PqqD